VNFGHRTWWYGGHFRQKAGKIWNKNYFQKVTNTKSSDTSNKNTSSNESLDNYTEAFG